MAENVYAVNILYSDCSESNKINVCVRPQTNNKC